MSTDAQPRSPGGPVLFYDDSCGVCAFAVQFVLRHERTRALRLASLQGSLGRTLLERQPALRGIDSVVFVQEPGAEPLTRSAAVLAVAAHLRLPWRLVTLLRAAPRGMRDAVYDLIARHRHKVWPGRQCPVPPPDLRERFLG